MDALEKDLPNSPEAERALLSALILTPGSLDYTIIQLGAEDFYKPINRTIFKAIREMQALGKAIEPALLADYLREKYAVSTPLMVIHEITNGVPAIVHLEPYIKQLKEKSRARLCIKKANELVSRIMDGGADIEETVQWASMSLDELAQDAIGSHSPLVASYSEFMKHQFTDGEVLAFHAARSEVCLLQSVTNKGKSTFARNSTLALTTGGEFLTVVKKGTPRRVLLFNFEGAGARFQRDLELMTRDFTQMEMNLVRDNLFTAHAPVVNGEPFTLSRHMHVAQAQARRIKPDVIIIDTASAAFDIRNENDNAEVQSVMKSLIRLARTLNCLIVLLHHIGKAKSEEGAVREGAHRGRGASAWADFSTTIINLEAVKDTPDQVILECAKRKDGEKYECILTLNRATRWFSISDQIPQRPPSNYDLVVEAVKGFNRDVKRAEINAALSGKVALATISRCLSEAVNKDDLNKFGHGLYRFNENSHQLISI